MLGSTTTQDRAGTCDIAPTHVAFRQCKSVSVLIASFRSSIPSPPVPLFTLRRTPRGVQRKTRGRAVRYSFLVGLFHSLLHAGLSRRTALAIWTKPLARKFTVRQRAPREGHGVKMQSKTLYRPPSSALQNRPSAHSRLESRQSSSRRRQENPDPGSPLLLPHRQTSTEDKARLPFARRCCVFGAAPGG